jgi:serine/threonine-protein kinase
MSSVDPGRATASSDETAAAPADLRAGAAATGFTPGTLLLGRYRIVSPLGKGGMGEVYRADDVRLGQAVALKFLPAALRADAGRLKRLEDEVRIGRQISHPNVCRLYDIAGAEGHHFLVMEYVDGEDLASLLRRIGRLPGDKVLEIARGMCAGLAAAHDKGVIHRDLKPANVMIDGRGHARIADFGLAALAEQGPASGLAGTPAYMAPEQFSGEGASLQSDVFALGLVLSEMLTGQRVFEPTTLEQLKALHAQWKPLSLSSSAKDVDPALERVVQRCLARDPKERPQSARAVLAALPGGDPLQAALLAGETPSPEMVAAASKVGDLPPSLAWAGLLAGLVGLALVATLAGSVMLHDVVPPTKPPEALRERAKQVLARVGDREPAADSAHGFELDRAAIEYLKLGRVGQGWWDVLRTSRPGAYRFWYRQSPASLWSRSWLLTIPFISPAELGRVTRLDPPLNVPGMSAVQLDMQGRLIGLVSVPSPPEAASPANEPDWSVALEEAGLAAVALQRSTPRWAAPVDTDRKAAWDGFNPDQPSVPLHVEAAAYQGRLVYFEMRGPWTARAGVRVDAPIILFTLTVVFAILILVLVATFVLFRRNSRLGRGDRRGASRLAWFVFCALALASVCRADHTTVPLAEYHLLILILSQSAFLAGLFWLIYMALEPPMRRRSPGALISWSRLLAGRFADPLVGRDVLVGAMAGLALTLLYALARVAPAWLGRPAMIPIDASVTTLASPWYTAYYMFLDPAVAVAHSLTALFFLYVLHAISGRAWAARLLFLAILIPPTVVTWGDDVLFGVVGAALHVALWLFLLVRFGLLGSVVFQWAFYLLISTPLTSNWSDWFAGRSFLVIACLASLLVFAFHTSLAGKPMFGKTLLED